MNFVVTNGVNQLAACQHKVGAQVAPWNALLADELAAASQKIITVLTKR
jgi:hypothetical protein